MYGCYIFTENNHNCRIKYPPGTEMLRVQRWFGSYPNSYYFCASHSQAEIDAAMIAEDEKQYRPIVNDGNNTKTIFVKI